ncbi:MAG: hypothetical protein GXY23_11855 [Myxococcales bacterium]|nr:hypothetical protein [Myxococcales bacterium]
MTEAARKLDDLLLLGETPEYLVAVHRNVMVMLIGGAIDSSFLRLSLLGHHKALEYEPSGYGVVTIAEKGARIPPPEIRDEASKLRKRTQHMLRGQSVIVGGDGFFASTMRAVITGIVAMAQSRVPMKMTGDLREAAQFVGEKLGYDEALVDELHDVLVELRSGR